MLSAVDSNQADTVHSNVYPCSEWVATELHKWFACSRNEFIEVDAAARQSLLARAKGLEFVQHIIADRGT